MKSIRPSALSAALTALVIATAARADEGFDADVLGAINARRESQGLSTLRPDARLREIALDHSREMAAAGQLSHEGFEQRFDRTTSRLCVEDLAAGYAAAGVIVGAWESSPAHRRNLFEPRLQRAGVAAVDGFVTYFACE